MSYRWRSIRNPSLTRMQASCFTLGMETTQTEAQPLDHEGVELFVDDVVVHVRYAKQFGQRRICGFHTQGSSRTALLDDGRCIKTEDLRYVPDGKASGWCRGSLGA